MSDPDLAFRLAVV
ncbi:hypothetical protein GJU43_18795 [Flavobacterium sp. LC2016-23]|nr:hypothetical protein [Flavobacterium sp. LC2016-23]